MKTASHQYEDKLLEFAYGELPPQEAEAVDAHVRSCSRCTEALSDIRMVRTTMDQIPMEEAPEVGLDSLFAYAEHQATRNRATAPSPWWRRVVKAPMVAAVSSVAALAVVGLLAWEANKAYAPSPGAVALQAEAKREAPSAPSPVAVEGSNHLVEKGAKVEAPVETERLEGPYAGAPGQPKMRRAKPASGSAAKEPTGGFVATGGASSEAKSQAQGKELSAGGRALREDDRQALDDDGTRARGSLARQELAEKKDNAAAPKSPAFDQAQVAETVAAPPPPAKSLGLSGFEPRASKKAEEAPLADKDEPRRLRALVEAARAAGLKGDLEAEVRFALAALASGVSGADRLDMLNRLCVGYERLGDPERGDPYCDRLLSEFPASASAGEITSRRKGVQRMQVPASSAAPAEAVEPAKSRPPERAK